MTQTEIKLDSAQSAQVQFEMVAIGTPVRFLCDGRNLNISTGELMPRGVNVMYHIVYWNFTKETANKIVYWLSEKTAIGVVAIFC